MPIALVNSVSAGSAAGDDITTAADDMAAADFLVAALGWKAVGGGNDNISDNQGNSYTRQTASSSGSDCSVRIDYKAAPTVNASHTFTGDVTPNFTTLPSIAAAGFSGVLQVAPANGENGSTGTAQSLSTGSVTPSQDGSLLIAALVVDRAVTGVSVNNGFTLIESVGFVSSQHQALYFAYLIQGTAAAVSCTFSWTTFANVAARISAFKPAAAAAGQPTIRRAGLADGIASLKPRGLDGVNIFRQREAFARRRSGVFVPSRYQEAA